MSRDNDKKCMMFFYDWIPLLEELDDAEIGQIVMAAYRYDQTGEVHEFADRSLRVVFKSIKNAIDLSNEKFASVSNARRKAASKRWNKNANDANASDAVQENASDAELNLLDLNRIELNGIEEHNIAPDPPQDELQEYVEYWNGIPHTVNVQELTPMTARYDQFRMCVSKYGKQGVLNAMDKVRDSKWLKKRGGVRFEKYMTLNVMQQLLEGAYDKDYAEDKKPQTQFNNFHQMDYDYDALEKKLAGY